MPLINTAVPNLIQGVSQQPDASRFAGQCEEQENALSSVASGLMKRPNTRHIARLLATAIDENSFVHFINRSDQEKYVVIVYKEYDANNAHTGCRIRGFNVLDGTEIEINYTTGGLAQTSSQYEYLHTSSPKDNLKALTIADRTFLLNTSKTVGLRKDTNNNIQTTPALEKKALIFIKQADYEKEYGINVTTQTSATKTAKIRSDQATNATGHETSTEIILDRLHDNPSAYDVVDPSSATSIKTDIDTTFGGEFYTKRTNNLIEMVRKDGTDFQISGFDGLADTGLGVVYKEVDSISDLPVTAPNGFVVKVRGDVVLSEDDYYVKFETNTGVTSTSNNITSTVGKGSWVETIAPSISKGVSNSTLPFSLINTGLNSFLLRETQFSERLVGDDNSNPLPSFVSHTIQNMFFFKNRLGFLSNENIIISESGLGALDVSNDLVFNFGRTSATTLLDSDPIDVSVSSGKVTNLKSAKGFQENLVLFSENGQFVMKGGSLLTPKTVSVTPITNFSFEDQVDPLPLGSYIYFPFTRGNFTGLREFTVNSTTDTYDSVEVTEHVPAYIPKNVIDMAGTTSEDMIALLSGDETGSLYIYNYFWNNNQKVLSAWSKFTFTGEVRGIEFVESVLYAVITNNGETNLVSLPLESGLKDDAGYVTHLDMRVAKTVTNGANTIDLSSDFTPADNSVEVYTTDGLKLNCTNVGATVTLAQAVSADTSVFVGIPYTMKYTFSEQLFKAKAGQGSSPSNAAKLMVRNGSLYFDNTAFFKVKVTPKFRDTYENIFTPDVVGSTTIGTLNLGNGFYRFPVFTKAQDTTITIENDSALPSNFQSAEFESFVHSRSNRYG